MRGWNVEKAESLEGNIAKKGEGVEGPRRFYVHKKLFVGRMEMLALDNHPFFRC